MPLYEYRAYHVSGKSERGTVDAENVKAARLKLKKLQLNVYEIAERGASQGGTRNSGPSSTSQRRFFSSVSVQDLALMTRQLASLVKSNIPLVECLVAMVEQTEHPILKGVLAQIKQDVNEGISLAKAFGKHGGIFDTIFINMVEAGEASGTLSIVLLRLADLKEAQMRLRSKIVAGMTYPGLIMGVSLIITIGLFTFVIPQLANIFEGMNKEMPPMTVLLLNISKFLVDYWMFLLGGVIFGVTFLAKFIRSEKGKPAWDRFLLRVPKLGSIIQMIGVTRFASTMSTLLGSGVPILNAMAIARNLVGNSEIQKAISEARDNITEGQSIADPLRRSGQFPPMVIHMIAIGEKTGELPAMLDQVASTYEEQVSTRIEAFTSIIEPVMIIGMGLTVGFVVVSVLVPLLDLSNIN